MLTALRLINFKCFRDETLQFKRLTIFAGANASGKSSVIQSLLLLESSNVLLENYGESPRQGTVDVNRIFGFQVGAPKALVSQNPIDVDEFDFAFERLEDDRRYVYQYQIDKASPLDLKVKTSDVFSGMKMQYLNAERIGPRVSNQAGNKNGISHDGENATYLMDIADTTGRLISPILAGNDGMLQKFSYYVERWMSAILGTMQLDFHTDYNKAITELRIKNELVDTGVVPTLTGFGISYVLPVVVAGLWAAGEDGGMLILENPEAHLHPYAQSNLGKFLALLAHSGVQVVVETHSEHIIDGARYQAAKLDFSEGMLVNFMQQDEGEIRTVPISVSSLGELSIWPKGFFDQKQQDLREIMMLRRKGSDCR